MILLVPSFDVRSDGPIRLGAVLSDPAYTKDKLRLRPSVKIPEYQIRSERMQGWKGVKSNRRLSRGLFTFYLSLNLGRNEETQELQAEELITKTFTPTREYITQ